MVKIVHEIFLEF